MKAARSCIPMPRSRSGKIETNVDALGVDLLTIAGHKIGAPKGVGALYVRNGTPIEPLIHGAGHEGGRRAGTESAMLRAALGAAARVAADLSDMPRVTKLRDRLWVLLQAHLGKRIVLNGHPELRLPNTANISFVGRVGADLLAGLDGVAASTGAACHSGRVELSPVLKAMGITPDVGMGAIRFSLGRATTDEEIDTVVDAHRDGHAELKAVAGRRWRAGASAAILGRIYPSDGGVRALAIVSQPAGTRHDAPHDSHRLRQHAPRWPRQDPIARADRRARLDQPSRAGDEDVVPAGMAVGR